MTEISRILLDLSAEVSAIPPPKKGLTPAERRDRLGRAVRINRLLEQLRAEAARLLNQQVACDQQLH